MSLGLGRRTLGAAAVLLAGSFVGTVITRSQPNTSYEPAPPSPAAQWLGLDEEQSAALKEHDPKFPEESAVLRSRLDGARQALAAAFDRPGVTDDELREKAEAVLEARNLLERRVMEHIIALRHHLTPEQCAKLFSLCADEVRQCQESGWRGGRGRDTGEPRETPGRRGGGRGRGRGFGGPPGSPTSAPRE